MENQKDYLNCGTKMPGGKMHVQVLHFSVMYFQRRHQTCREQIIQMEPLARKKQLSLVSVKRLLDKEERTSMDLFEDSSFYS